MLCRVMCDVMQMADAKVGKKPLTEAQLAGIEKRKKTLEEKKARLAKEAEEERKAKERREKELADLEKEQEVVQAELNDDEQTRLDQAKADTDSVVTEMLLEIRTLNSEVETTRLSLDQAQAEVVRLTKALTDANAKGALIAQAGNAEIARLQKEADTATKTMEKTIAEYKKLNESSDKLRALAAKMDGILHASSKTCGCHKTNCSAGNCTCRTANTNENKGRGKNEYVFKKCNAGCPCKGGENCARLKEYLKEIEAGIWAPPKEKENVGSGGAGASGSGFDVKSAAPASGFLKF